MLLKASDGDPEDEQAQVSLKLDTTEFEILTPRWVLCDAKRYGIKLGDEVWTTLQDRAYMSPIWYTPLE